MGKQTLSPGERAEPDWDDVRSKDSLDYLEPVNAGRSLRPPPQARSHPIGWLVGGAVVTAGLVWGGLQGYDMFLQYMDTYIETQVATERKILTEEMQRLTEERVALLNEKNSLNETISKADQQSRQAMEELKTLKAENQKLKEELKKQNLARKKIEEDKTRLEEREKQAKEKHQADEARSRQESAKLAEDAKILAAENSRLLKEKKQLEEAAKAPVVKAKTSEITNSPTVDQVDKDLNNGHLIEPKGNNALEKLASLSKLDAGNKALPPRWSRLTELLIAQADQAIGNKDLRLAEHLLKNAEKIPGATGSLAKAKQRLLQAQEASHRLDLEVLRRAEEEEVAQRLERSRANDKPQPPTIKKH